MDRKRRISGCLLAMLTCITGCVESDELICEDERKVSISIQCPSFQTKAEIPQEDKINDINLIIFENGTAETIYWDEDPDTEEEIKFETSFVKGRSYSIFAMANIGKMLEIREIKEIDDLSAEVGDEGFGMSGLPMSAYLEDIPESEWGEISMELVRMVAKISICMDRSRLSEDVEMTVKSVRIGNYPKYALASGPSKVISSHDRYENGHILTPVQCNPLNIIGHGGISEEVSLYMLENMHGSFPYEIEDDEEKILDEDDRLYGLASYLEIEIHYSSKDKISYDSNLIYRFYLGEGRQDLNIERNCHYHIRITPEDDGLSGGGWRVDKSGIGPSVPFFRMMPGDFVEGHVGDTLRIWCECYPRTSPFDPGYEELDFDKDRGIYDYKVDDDLHGVTLYLKKPGTGIVYMTAGEPINREEMVIVTVYP